MTWRTPEVLWLLLLVPALASFLWWKVQARRRTTARFGNEDTVAGLVQGRAAKWRLTRGILWVVGLAFLIAGLAGPQYGSRTRLLRKRGVDVVIALDFSKSMLARDVSPNRIDRAKAELRRLLQELDGDRVGLVAFAGDTIEFPMTVDYSAMQLFLKEIGPEDLPVGGTAIGRALIASKRLIERSTLGDPTDPQVRPRARVVLLLTDGEDHEGDPIAAAEELKEAGIKVYAVGVGSEAGEPIPTYSSDGTWTGHVRDPQGELVTSALTPENEAVLKQIAEITEGEYFRARAGTVGVAPIREQLRQLEQTERKARRITVHENRYALLLLPAFLLLVLEGLLPEAWIIRRRRRG